METVVLREETQLNALKTPQLLERGCNGRLWYVYKLGECSVRVSNELGAGKPKAARSAVAVSMGIGLVNGLVMALLILLLRNVWGWTFSNDQEVVDRVASTAPYLAVLAFLYGCQAILSGQDLGRRPTTTLILKS